ncbi:hypothetical protein CFP56_028767 [Quercus suber]|uniref:Uncharacterized protein n=1 Tax=Quercus suber TaxID=58331 RepID=A0AAW0LWY5_QUESU
MQTNQTHLQIQTHRPKKPHTPKNTRSK